MNAQILTRSPRSRRVRMRRVCIRRMHTRLAALQRAAQAINAAHDIERIAELALACARDITHAEAGVIRVALPGLPPTMRATEAASATGAAPDERQIATAMIHAAASDGPTLLPPGALIEPLLLPEAGSRLLAPIRQGDRVGGRFLGALILESRRPQAFDDQDVQVMHSLADHVVIALENARRFDEVRAERRKSEQIIETMADALIAADAAGQVLVFNPAAELLTGWRRQDAIGRHLCDVLGCKGDPTCAEGARLFSAGCPLLDALRTGDILREEQCTIRTRDGMRRVISLSAAAPPAATPPLDGDLRQGLVVVARDVTAREETEAFQRELVATFSHDLRAPLTNINVLVDMLAGGGLESGQVNFEYLNSLRAQSRRLTDLVERTLDLARMDAGQWTLEPRPVRLSRLLEEAVRMWREAARDRLLYLDLPPASLWVWADERAVVTALGNLIDNALKYSTPGTEVTVSAASAGGEAVIAVHNEGPAIAPEHQTRLFERFYRADRSDSRRVYGFGLGLYIARKLVEGMGGRIWVVSEPANGTRFAFTAPLVKEDQLETADH
jgi:two-component system, OmpR family, phosphate regulon sensor histidine kinase PhoR